MASMPVGGLGDSGEDVGGDYSPGPPDQTPSCASDRICQCLSVSNTAIATAIQKLTVIVGQQMQSPCQYIDQCLDYIIKKIDERYRKPQATCQQCRDMVNQGMAGTLEFAVRCAFVQCDQIKDTCSPGDPSTWGKPCPNCESPDGVCCCNQGNCEPGPCEDKSKSYYGWCNDKTGVIVVTEAGKAGPGEGWKQVAIGDNEQAVAIEAAKNCSKENKAHVEPPQPSQSSPLSGPYCSLDWYNSGAGPAQIAQAGSSIFDNAAGVESLAALGRVGLDGINLENLGEVLFGLWNAQTNGPPQIAHNVMPAVANALGCGSTAFKGCAEFFAALGLIEKYTGLNLNEFATPYKYAMHSVCRQKFLDPDKAMAAYLANAINPSQLDTHWAVNGLCPDAVQWYTQAAKAKPIPHELGLMLLREIIDRPTYLKGMRELGYLEYETADKLFRLFEQLPTQSDIIRLMVRDADDESPNGPVVKFNLDYGFEQKYGGQLKEWSQHQGVSEKFAKYAWRAHWNIPSPTQLFDFYHRLRNKPGYETLGSDIEAALIQQDILPYWHKHYLATSFLPLGRVDIRRAFGIGSIGRDDLKPLYSQLGYDDETCDTLVDFSVDLKRNAINGLRPIKLWLSFAITRQQAVQQLQRYGYDDQAIDEALREVEVAFSRSAYGLQFTKGLLPVDRLRTTLENIGVSQVGIGKIIELLSTKLTHHSAVPDYIVGVIDEDEARQQMVAYGFDSDNVDAIMRDANQKIDHQLVLRCQNAIRRRYLMGEIDRQEAVNLLLKNGTTLKRANKLSSWWGCEKGSRDKPIAVAKLCDWLGKGIINSLEFTNRLKNLGYGDLDAQRIVNDCLVSLSAKQQKLAQQQAKQTAREQARIAAEQLKLARQIEAEKAKHQRAVNQRAATTARRQKQLLSAAAKVSAKCLCDTYDSLQSVKAEQQRIITEYGLDLDESLQVLIQAAEAWPGGEIETFPITVSQYASAVSGVDLSPDIDPDTDVVITGGDTQPS